MKQYNRANRPLRQKKNKIVLCNQAADLDSVACAYVYSRITGAIPFIPIPSRDLRLRSEIIHALETAGIDRQEFLFADTFVSSPEQEITLVDHNALPHFLRELEPDVKEIIDHHAPEGNLIQNPDVRCTLERTGSCAALVGEILLEQVRQKRLEAKPEWIYLLSGAILLDTYNFSPETGTATEKDRQVLTSLADLHKVDTEKLFRELSAKKTDFSGFTPEDYLRKDYKEFIHKGVRCGFSAIYRSLEPIADRNFTEEAFRFCRKRNLDIFIIMTVYRDSRLHKETAFLSGEGLPDAGKMAEFFNSRSAGLVHSRRICTGNGDLEIFRLENITLSRKHIVPFTKEFIEYNQKT